MPHVSKHKLSKKVVRQIQTLLISVIRSGKTASSTRDILFDLLTETEQVMLAKRLSVVFLLKQGKSVYYIMNALSMSPNTVSYMSEQLESGQYKHLEELFNKKKEREVMQDWIDIFIRAGMPSRGKDRWKGFGK